MGRLNPNQRAFAEAIWAISRGDTSLTNGKDHIILDAKAGSGKTFTITYCMGKYIPTTQRVIAVMFNKKNAVDIQGKLPKTGNVEGVTTHSLGGRACVRGGTKRLAGNNGSDKMKRIFGDMQLGLVERKLLPEIRKMVSVAKSIGLVPNGMRGYEGLVPDDAETWAEIIDHYSLDFDEDWQEEAAIEISRSALRESIKQSTTHDIDFDDMLYLPVVAKMQIPKYDWVFIDEAQDINGVQRELVKRAVRQPGGHLVAVGDPNQAIYGFRGADSESMENIRKEMDAFVMPLSTCFRCDKNIIREAKHVVPGIEYQDSKEDGHVYQWLPKRAAMPGEEGRMTPQELFTPDCAILGPFNAPLVKIAFALIRNRIACHMIGREFGKGLLKLLKKLDVRTVAQASTALDAYYAEQFIRLQDKEEKLQAMTDMVETLKVFLEDAPANESVDRVANSINALFDENLSGMVTISSIHRSKGSEWPRVFLIDADALNQTVTGKRDKQRPLLPWEIQQRRNLLYVGITRAEHELYYATKDEMEMFLS